MGTGWPPAVTCASHLRFRLRRVATQLGYGADSVRLWVRQADIDDGDTPGVTTDEAARSRELEQENRELRRANEMAFDRRSSRTSRSSSASRCASVVVVPGRSPASTPAWVTQFRSVSV